MTTNYSHLRVFNYYQQKYRTDTIYRVYCKVLIQAETETIKTEGNYISQVQNKESGRRNSIQVGRFSQLKNIIRQNKFTRKKGGATEH